MKICTIANQKGGVGKTTTAAAVGGILANRGYRVLLLDCDPHASLTSYFGFQSDHLESSIFDLFAKQINSRQQVKNIAIDIERDQLSLIPASLSLATLDKRFGTREGMGLVLQKTLNLVKDDYDFALIDCPPVLGMLMINALAACQQLLVPVQTEYLALKGLERMMETLKMVIKAQHHSIDYKIIPTMFDRRTNASIKALKSLRQDFALNVWEDVIPVDTKFRDASQAHRTPANLYPKTHGVLAYQKLVNTLLAMSSQSKVA